MPRKISRKLELLFRGASFPLLKLGGGDTIFIDSRFEGRTTQSSDSIVRHIDNMKIFLSAFLVILPAIATSGEPAWSKPVNGIRGRLIVLSPDKDHYPFNRVFVEFENVADVANPKKIPFTPFMLKLSVTDKEGKPLAKPQGLAYDGLIPIWEPLLLPFAGNLKFQVSFPGAGYRPSDRSIIDVGPDNVWIVPQDGSKYYLSGTLSIRKKKSDHPFLDWSGVLEFPKVEIPDSK